MMRQSTSHIFLVRPANFGYNSETADSNLFQNKPEDESSIIKENAIAEFDAYIEKLRSNNIDVTVIEDTSQPVKPDAVFSNNWGSFHADGTVILYPMAAANRRIEKRTEILESFKEKFLINKIVDLSHYEEEGKFLEGTGSVIFDHSNKYAYACLSPRTDKEIFEEVCAMLGYKPVCFTSTDINNQEIYHTNVMMCVSDQFSVICLESIKDEDEQLLVIQSLEETGHEIIDITDEQMRNFAGNMLSVNSLDGQEYLVMSQSAHNILTEDQKEAIESYCIMLPVSIDTIETVGGGSARCMISELFLPVKE